MMKIMKTVQENFLIDFFEKYSIYKYMHIYLIYKYIFIIAFNLFELGEYY